MISKISNRYMKLIYEAGADAVIVQDLGVMSFIP